MRLWRLALKQGFLTACLAAAGTLIAQIISYLVECGFKMPAADFVFNRLALTFGVFFVFLVVIPFSVRSEIRGANQVKPKKIRRTRRWL